MSQQILEPAVTDGKGHMWQQQHVCIDTDTQTHLHKKKTEEQDQTTSWPFPASQLQVAANQ